MTDLADFANEVYDDSIRLEEQDLRLLKALVSDDNAARQIAAAYGSELFVGDAAPFADAAISYFKTYNNLPTRRVMLDESPVFEYIWDELDRINYNKSEFSYDLDKIQNRFVQQEVFGLRRDLDELDPTHDPEGVLRDIKTRIEKAEKVKRGKEAAYTQKTLKAYMPEFKDEFKAKVQNPELGRGIMTGYSYLDYVTNGLQPTDMLIVGAETGGGKMLPLDTLIPTPDGFKQNKDLKVGDKVFGRDGKVCNIVAESNIETQKGWKFIFNDGSEVISHDNHEWLTFDRKEQVALSKRTPEFRAKEKAKRKSRAVKNTKPWLVESNKNREYELLPPPTGTIRTSKEIAKTLFVHQNKRRNHAIPITKPIELPEKELLIDPYLFGCWLGDGSSKDGAITSMDVEIIDCFVKEGYEILNKITRSYKNGVISKASTYKFLGFRAELKKLGVFGNKHIPHDYLWASKDQRLALLQGLMDTDGFASKDGKVDFVNTNKNIVEGVAHLVRSLGEKCTITEGKAKLYGRVTGPKWTVRFSSSLPVFRLPRKLKRQNLTPRLNKFRYIVDAIRVPALPMKCIQVDSSDHIYLCTENFIPTHNSMLLANMAAQIWMQKNTLEDPSVEAGKNVLYFSLEMPFDQCARRTFARLSQISTYALRDAHISKQQAKRLAQVDNFIENYESEFEIVDIPRGVTAESIEERFLESVTKGHRPDVVVVDYLGLMSAPDIQGDDWLKLGEIAGKLHEFARAQNVVVLTAVQLNRPKGKDPNDIVGLHRIGRSSNIMHHASIGIQIETRPDEDTYADLPYHIIKNRNGERGHHILKKQFKYATLVDQDSYRPQHDNIGSFTAVNQFDDLTDTLKDLGW